MEGHIGSGGPASYTQIDLGVVVGAPFVGLPVIVVGGLVAVVVVLELVVAPLADRWNPMAPRVS